MGLLDKILGTLKTDSNVTLSLDNSINKTIAIFAFVLVALVYIIKK